MLIVSRVVFTGAVMLTMGGAAAGCRQSAPPAPEGHAEAVEKWRAKHEVDYRRDWVTIAGLHLLKPGVNTAGSDSGSDVLLPGSVPGMIGRFVRAETRVRFEPVPDAPVLLKGQPVTAAVDLKDDSGPDADELIVGAVRLTVHVSGETRSIRVRDPGGPLATGFLGFTWFSIDPRYRVVGRFIKDPAPQRLKVLNTYGDIDSYLSEGVVEFTLLGQSLRLRPFTTRPRRFYFVFRDASSGQETYEAARFVYADLLDDGTTVIDFNEAYNPPCAFNPYTTCPIPLAENRLPVKILAGEKAYPIHVPLPSGRTDGK
jgi:uncharacterized protein